MSSDTARQEFQRYLERRLQHARLRLLAHGLVSLAVLGVVVTALAAWSLGATLPPPLPIRLGLALVCLVILLSAGNALVVRPLRRLGTSADLCRELERDGSFANCLIAAEEACRRRDRWDRAPGVSAELVRRLFARVIAVASQLSAGRLLPLPWATRSLLGALVLTVVLLGLVQVAPEQWRRGYTRLSQPWLADGGPATVGLYLTDGPREILAGQDVVVAAADFGDGTMPVACEVRSGTGLWRQVTCLRQGRFAGEPAQRWEAQLNDLQESFTYRFRREGLTTASRRVEVRHPPLLTRLAGRVIPPAYTGLAAQDLPHLPSYLELLAGSRLRWRGLVNHPVHWAVAISTAGDTVPLITRGDSVRGEIVVDAPLTYSFHLRDAEGLASESRLDYELAVLIDALPQVRLWRSQDDGLLPVAGIVQLRGEAADDFGLARVDLLCRREEGHLWQESRREVADPWERLTVWDAGDAARSVTVRPEAREFTTEFGPLTVVVEPPDSTVSPLRWRRGLELRAGDLELLPGDALVLCLEVLDNRQPGPAGRSRSRTVRLVLPAAADILTAQATEGENRLAELAELRQRSEALGHDLDRLDRELQKDPDIDWNRQQELAGAIARQQALQEELSQLADQLQNDLSGLMENHLTSLDLVQKMDQVASLLAEIDNAELDQLLTRLQEAVAQLSSHEIREAIEDVAHNQKEFVRRLDRALALLKEMAREQELEGLTSLLARMMRQQQDLLAASREQDQDTNDQSPAEGEPQDQDPTSGDENNQQQDSSGQDGEAEAGEADERDEELADRQEVLAEEMERLQEQLREAQKRLQEEREAGDTSPSAEELSKALEQGLKELAERKPSESMRKAARNLQESNPEQAGEQQQQALRDLAALYHVLLVSQQGMQMALMTHQVTSLRQLAADLLDLSVRQEEISDLVPRRLRDVRSGPLTRQQFRVLKGGRALRDRLQNLPSSSPREIMRLLDKIDGLIAQLTETVRDLEEGRGKHAQRTARQSLGAMNEIVIALLTQAQKSCQGGSCTSSCSTPSLARQLKEMARDQAGLNGLADQLARQLQESGLSQQLRAQMRRLQGEQGQLGGRAREIADLEREQTDGERLLGDMEQLALEMEGVSRDLDSGLVTEETLARQERILGRLLDMHNAARKRDFSTRRTSRTADRLYTLQNQGGPSGREESPDEPFQLRYQPVEKAPLEYRELVRRYFRALERLHATDRSEPVPEVGP